MYNLRHVFGEIFESQHSTQSFVASYIHTINLNLDLFFFVDFYVFAFCKKWNFGLILLEKSVPFLSKRRKENDLNKFFERYNMVQKLNKQSDFEIFAIQLSESQVYKFEI
jgi:hypothetical protein